jgi:hypothetical protein
MYTGVVERTVPGTSLAPFAPGDVVAILAVGISRLPRCTEEALAGAGDEVARHRRGRQHGKQDGGSAEKSKFCHVFLREDSGKQENKRISTKFLSRFLKDI